MNLSKLLSPWLDIQTDCDISALHNDTRMIKPGCLFFATKGSHTDGRLYLKEAKQAGAVAVVYDTEDWPQEATLPEGIITIPLPNLNQHIPEIASRFYAEPSKKMTITGVTGTNGKTTIAYQLAQAYEKLAVSSAYIGTLGQGRVASLETTANTTPPALQLQGLLSQYVKNGIQQVAMEVSSHALVENRVGCVAFKQAIFTNLTHDHLDFHQTMEAYCEAKTRLFAFPSLEWAIINEDDAYGAAMKAACHPSLNILGFGINNTSQVRAVHYKLSMQGTTIEVESPWGKHALHIQALGHFNISNALAIFTSLMAAGYESNKVVSIMSELAPAPGRMEVVHQSPCILVDYAHTPDALKQALLTLGQVKKKRILLVFGCGGDRDKSKRPVMGAVGARYADEVIITSDNPRTEDPLAIIRDIQKGTEEGTSRVHCIVDRREAIAAAIKLAEHDDIILVAGKGHEPYQEIGRERQVFSDKIEIQRLIKEQLL